MRFMRHEGWSDALFASWPVDASLLEARLPEGLVPDLHEGCAYLSIVALTESGICPWPPGVPIWLAQLLRLSHHAVNVRTYVRPRDGGPPGIFFFSLDCSALLPTLGAKLLFNLPYRYARMRRGSGGQSLVSERRAIERSAASFRSSWHAAELQSADRGLSTFLVERYRLYNTPSLIMRVLMRGIGFESKPSRYWHGSITHAPWPLYRAELENWHSTMLEALGFEAMVIGPSVTHCSRQGVGPINFYWEGLS